MLFDPVNIVEELQKEREKALLDEVQRILLEDAITEGNITERIQKKSKEEASLLEISKVSHLIFSKKEIKAICVKYRLRFLDSKRFKGKIPYEAILKVKEFERKHQTEVRYFKIIAPAESFKLEDNLKDPLLFAELGSGKYCLLHQWGSDMEWHQKLLLFPFRNIKTLGIYTASLAILITLFLPASFMPEFYQKTIGLVFFYKAFSCFILTGLLFTFSLIYGIKSSKDFSENVWESKYFN
ncbi:MAG: hypothetical protein COA57_12080 [Flavobacteriales bacterium]|nr:MAG: hypothetical protein COA57_12080 [Flavobacteriales bacterium]